MERNEYTAANRVAWNEAAPIHARLKFEELLTNFRQPGYNLLDPIEKGLLEQIGVEGKAVAQLSCNNGRELLSVKNMGAGRCVGFDISDEFIEQGRQLNAAADQDCEFVQTDIFEVPRQYDQSFDLAYVTIGALCWLPDLTTYFEVVRRLLRPGGYLFIYEMHPMLDMFEGDDKGDPPTLRYSYFRTEPYVESGGLDYYGGQNYQSATMYSFHHKLSEIIGGCLKAGLSLEHFEEYGHDISNVFAGFEKLNIKPPLCYTLVARLNK